MCIYKCMLNVYKNQQNRQTGSRNLISPKTLPTIWGTYMKLVAKYQISGINSCWEKCNEKWAYMFNVYTNQLSRQTGSRNLTGPKTLPTIWYTYMKLVTKKSDFCHQRLLRKMRRKISWTDGRTDRGKTVYLTPPSGSGGIITNHYQLYRKHQINISYNRVTLIMKRKFKQWWSSIPPISKKQTITAHHNWTQWT
jgi:hypothetical protein